MSRAGELVVTSYAPRPNHGGLTAHHSVVLEIDTGEQYETFSRAFHCPCGEPMHDGDPAIFRGDVFLAHSNCAAVLA